MLALPDAVLIVSCLLVFFFGCSFHRHVLTDSKGSFLLASPAMESHTATHLTFSPSPSLCSHQQHTHTCLPNNVHLLRACRVTAHCLLASPPRPASSASPRRCSLFFTLQHIAGLVILAPLESCPVLLPFSSYLLVPGRHRSLITVARYPTRFERRHNAFHRSRLQHQWPQQQGQQCLCCHWCLSLRPFASANGSRRRHTG